MAIIWILMLWMTVYLWNSGDRAKSIEAEWCANALWWVLSNYVYYTLTSRNLRVVLPDGSERADSPSYYYIQLTWWTSNSSHRCTPENIWGWHFCNDILLLYATWYENPESHTNLYRKATIPNTCRNGKPHLWFYRSGWAHTWNIEYIRMNKWFTPRDVQGEKVFYIKDNNWEANESKTQLLTGNIIVVLCTDETCGWRKEIGKWQIDARAQTISFKKCRYYREGEESNLCKTREDCAVYDETDPTLCIEY